MPVPTFTVPSTGTFVSASTGGRYKYAAGDVIALDIALDLEMPGAEPPQPEGQFNTAQQAAIDAAIAAAITDADLADVEEIESAVTAAVGGLSLGDLGDVTLTDPQTDDALTFDGEAWVNTAPAGGEE